MKSDLYRCVSGRLLWPLTSDLKVSEQHPAWQRTPSSSPQCDMMDPHFSCSCITVWTACPKDLIWQTNPVYPCPLWFHRMFWVVVGIFLHCFPFLFPCTHPPSLLFPPHLPCSQCFLQPVSSCLLLIPTHLLSVPSSAPRFIHRVFWSCARLWFCLWACFWTLLY